MAIKDRSIDRRELDETDDDYRKILKEENREIVGKEENFLGNNTI